MDKKVFNKDLRSGVNPTLSSSVCDWNWAGGCKPPSHVSKVPIYSNRQEQLVLQDKIDWMYDNNICDVYDSSKYGPLEFCTPCMLVPKGSAKGCSGCQHLGLRLLFSWQKTQCPVGLYQQLQCQLQLESSRAFAWHRQYCPTRTTRRAAKRRHALSTPQPAASSPKSAGSSKLRRCSS